MTEEQLLYVLKEMSELGVGFFNRKTMNEIKPTTALGYAIQAGLNIYENQTEYLKTLTAHQYFDTDHWKQLTAGKLAEQPTCEGCGNRATKIFLIDWGAKAEETFDDVVSICSKCRVSNGRVISHKDVKSQIRESITTDPEYKEMIENEVREMIGKTTKDYLTGKERSRDIERILGGK